MLHRRDAMFRLGQLGLGSLTLPELLQASASSPPPRGRARSCILVYLWGGPPQQDMWDLKLAAPQGIRTVFQPIRTATPGTLFCEHLPQLARHTNHLALIRSMTHASTVHEPSVYYTLTGKQNPTLVSPRNPRRRTDFPNVASIVSSFSPPGDLPATVTIPRPIGHDGVTYAGTYAGFLGPRHDPLELREAPNSGNQPAHPLELPPDVDRTRLVARHGLRTLLENQDRYLQRAPETAALGGFYEQAQRMMTSPAARRAFNLEREPTRVRDRYGRNEYGESFLLARRLVEAGVRLTTITWMYFMPNGRISNVWDTHGGIGGLGGVTGFAMLRAHYCLPPLDQGLSALIEDLQDRGLLDETLIVVTGEFGRTPRINPQQGREHWGPCYTSVLCGGGIRGGAIYGSSDSIGAYPRSNPVAPEDLLATIYEGLGISPTAEIQDRENRPIRITEGRPLTALFG